MADQNLLTIFLAITALAVLIQTGILVGFYFASLKLSRQFDQIVRLTHNVFGPLENAVENLRNVTARVAEFSASTRGQLRQIENWWRKSA
jgi:cell shape-determining protein MreC